MSLHCYEGKNEKKKVMLKKFLAVGLSATMILFTAGCGLVNKKESLFYIKESVSTIDESSVEETTEIVEDGLEDGAITNNAVAFAKNLKLGWNLGNTLDAKHGSGLDSETSWGMPKATKELIQYVKEAGFTTIRIPVSWHNHIIDGVIDPAWVDRVQEVVDWSLEVGLYVIINSHHDNDEYYPREDNMDHAKEFLTIVWTEIANRFKDYDEHLIFEGMNEPRLAGTDKEWYFTDTDADGITCIKYVNELNQTFVDVVRKGDNYNKTRFLMVPSAIAAPHCALNANMVMPTDTIDNRLILSVHAYTPYDFTMNDNGYDKWDSSKKNEFDFMEQLKTRFIDQGYGVVIGEFGATNKDNIESRCVWAKDYCSRASSLGIPCILWDNGKTGKGNENFGMINRRELSIYYPDLLNAMLE